MPWIRPLTLSVALVAGPALSHANDLTPRDLVELARSGLGDEVLVALVEVDGGPFDLSPVDLLDLQAEGLSDRVLAALVRAGRHVSRDGVAFVDAPPASAVAEIVEWTSADDWPVTRTVAVPVPVYVPVVQQRTFPRGRRTRDTDRDRLPVQSTLGTRRGPVTVDSIRYAPPGFHPGTVRSRAPAARHASSADPAGPSTPGIARSTAGATRPPPGVARSQRP